MADDTTDWQFVGGALAFALALTLGTCDVDAQSRITSELALARICLKEEGWQITEGCAAIHQVLVRGAERRHMTYVGFARAYSPGAFDITSPRCTRPWIATLWPDGRQPLLWPQNVRWSVHRPLWFALYKHATDVIRGTVPSPCAEEPDHWGGTMDHDRGVRFGWRLVDCGVTARNEFWSTQRR